MAVLGLRRGTGNQKHRQVGQPTLIAAKMCSSNFELCSIRWKSLLGFQCRNRLLLSGTPVQNSMAELWALLHFIMPMLFDSHDEFAEWFSKDIENVAENKGSIDESNTNHNSFP
jgi:SNF2-related domain